MAEPIETAERSVCGGCPFRASNHGKRAPKGWYSRANLLRLWQGVSEGERLVCAELRTAQGRAAKHECAGALYLVLRHLEAAKHGTLHRAAIPLSTAGLARWRSRLVPTPLGRRSEAAAPPFYLSSSKELGVPWDCPVTNASGALGDELENEAFN